MTEQGTHEATRDGSRDSDGPIPTCQVCGESLNSERPVLACQVCETPHHQDCWEFAGGCSTFACTGQAQRTRALPGHSAHHPAGGAPVVTILDDGITHVDGQPTASGGRHFIETVHGETLDTTIRYTRLDLDTPLEIILQRAALILTAIGFLSGREIPLITQIVWPLATLCLIARLCVDSTYILDNERREILQHFSAFKFSGTWRICSFDDVRFVSVGGYAHNHSTISGTRWTYAVIIQTASRHRLRVTDDTPWYHQATGAARLLAQHLGSEYRPAPAETVGHGWVTGSAMPMEEEPVTFEPEYGFAWGNVRLRWVGLLLLTVLLNAHLLGFF